MALAGGGSEPYTPLIRLRMRDRAERILIVDDDPVILDLYRRVLEPVNVEIDSAHDGLEAIRKIISRRYVLIFLDLMMPEMSGFQVIRWLRASEPELLRAVVVVTALSPEAYREQLDPALVRDLVAKPFEAEALVNYVRKRAEGDAEPRRST